MSLNGIPFLFELIGDPLTATLFLGFYSNPISSTNINAGLPFSPVPCRYVIFRSGYYFHIMCLHCIKR